MVAIPKDILGSSPTDNLANVVAQAGGTPAHLDLFTFLLTPSAKIELKDNPIQKGILQDFRAANSLLFLFPPQVQVTLSILFYLQERKLVEDFSNVYKISSKVIKPSEVLSIHQSLNNLPISSLLISFLNREDFNDAASLKYLLNLPSAFFNELEESLNKTLDKVFSNYALPFSWLEDYKEIACTNNRLKAGVFIGNSLGYSFPYIQSLVNIIELWLLQNSSI